MVQDKKSYMVYRTAPYSMTVNDLKPRFQGHESTVYRFTSTAVGIPATQ